MNMPAHLSSVQSSISKPKKRGRKTENWEKYVQDALEKINQYKEKLRTAQDNNVSIKDRQKWRNLISAQESRLKKKIELKFLHFLLNCKDQRLEILFDIIQTKLDTDPETLKGIAADL